MITQPSYKTYLDAKQLLLQGELVAFPTETVYGLGANALDENAVKKIFETKGRPQKNPIIVHVGSISQINEYAEIQDPIEQIIIDTLMPGPLTMLLKKKSNISALVTAGSDFVGIRIPSNQVALDLLQTVQLPIAAPSANISTKPSPTSAEMVWDNFHDNVPMIIDGGSSDVGIESTVLKVESNRVLITRPGYISKEDIELAINYQRPVEYAQTVSEITPGNMFKHYSPKGSVSLLTDLVAVEILSKQKRTALLVTQERYNLNQERIKKIKQDNLIIYIRGTKKNLISCAKNLFSLYHKADQDNIAQLYVEPLAEQGLGYAIMNRVKKSCDLI